MAVFNEKIVEPFFLILAYPFLDTELFYMNNKKCGEANSKISIIQNDLCIQFCNSVN